MMDETASAMVLGFCSGAFVSHFIWWMVAVKWGWWERRKETTHD